MRHKSIVLVGSLAAVVLAVAIVTDRRVEAKPGADDPAALPLEELRVFAEVFGRIKNDYVESVDDKNLLRYAIRGMLGGLDPHSAYLSEDEFNDLRVGTSGEFGGLGIEVGMEDGFVKVIAPIDDTPAQRAGILAGDVIVRLDNKPVKGLSLDAAVKQMRGKPGSELILTVVREGVEKPLEIKVIRAVIKVASVKQRILEPGFGYIRVSHFQARTPEDMLRSLSKLKKANGGRLNGLVLDLRNNPGGVLNAAVAISDAFLTEGTIVYTEGRVNDSQLKFKAAPDDLLEGAPLVVLVNGGSASASEIVAGALQDHNRAVVMGRQTFGKGSVQTIIPINDNSAIKLTTARYYTPNGRSIQAEGIVPDIILEDVTVASKESGGSDAVKEADLAGHLQNPNGTAGTKGEDREPQPESLAEKDYELNEALNLLKGLAILSQRSDKG